MIIITKGFAAVQVLPVTSQRDIPKFYVLYSFEFVFICGRTNDSELEGGNTNVWLIKTIN